MKPQVETLWKEDSTQQVSQQPEASLAWYLPDIGRSNPHGEASTVGVYPSKSVNGYDL